MRAALTVAATLALAARADAEPLRLRGDALASAQSPVGLLVLGGDGGVAPGVSAEALVWMGTDADHGDALVMAVVARRADRRAEVRLGRLIATAGALRPQHVDGVAGRARLPARFDVEAFGGVPVVPQLGVRAWDWLAGGRIGRRLGEAGVGDLVAVDALDVAVDHVDPVAEALAHDAPGRRHVLGVLAGAAARGEHQREHHQQARLHGVPPAGWHIRHGIAPIGCRLDQPGGCGLPPGPPTLWQPTHSCSPAPPWQLAHATGSRRAAAPWALAPGPTPIQPGGCGLVVVEVMTPRSRWQSRQRSGAWQVVQVVGIARAASLWRAMKPGRCADAAIGSAGRSRALKVGAVTPWQLAQKSARWQLAHASAAAAARCGLSLIHISEPTRPY